MGEPSVLPERWCCKVGSLRILVYPHTLELGGSQFNAIELAAAVRDRGHDVSIFGQPGPLVDLIGHHGLTFFEAPRPGWRPSPRVLRALTRVAAEHSIDVVHCYEWTTALESHIGPRLQLHTPTIATVLSMAVAPFIPFDLPLIVGTEKIGAVERERGRANAPSLNLLSISGPTKCPRELVKGFGRV